MTKHIIAFFILAFLVGSCAPATTSPAPPPATVTATATPSIVPSATLTITPYPSLSTQGPYLLFTRDNKNLTLMDSDGGGRKQIELPNNGYIFQLNKSVSPDGKWLAYFTGSVEQPYDVALNLLDLSAERTQFISNLLAFDFPENLAPIVDTMVLGDPPIYDPNCFQDLECRRSRVQRELTDGIFSFDWSPDSRSIDFTAQIDGPSSDIYTYTIQDKVIHQLTNEPENIYSLDMAPNGQSLLYKINSVPGLGFEGSEWRLINHEGTPIPFSEDLNLEYVRLDGDDWLSENLYLLLVFSDVDPLFSDFTILNTDTGQVKEVWNDTADSFAINKENQTIVLLHKIHATPLSTIPEGIYIVYLTGRYFKISDVGIQIALFEGKKPYPIFLQDYNWQFYSIGDDGSIDILPWKNDTLPWGSPDGKLLLFKEDQKLALYTNSYQPIKVWSLKDGIHNITWSPDSLGVFIFTDLNIYHLAIPNGELHPLSDNCSPKQCNPAHFVWVP